MNKRKWYLAHELREMYEKAEKWMEIVNAGAPASAKAYQVDAMRDSKKWVWMHTSELYVSTALRGVGFAVLLSFFVLTIGTHNIITARAQPGSPYSRVSATVCAAPARPLTATPPDELWPKPLFRRGREERESLCLAPPRPPAPRHARRRRCRR